MNLNSYEVRMARGLRIGIVRQQYKAGNLTEQEAVNLLSDPLTPGDDSTIVDDIKYLHESEDYIIEKVLGEQGAS